MAYQTGASVSFSALMDAVKAFAVANSWTLAVDDSYTLPFAGSGVTHSSNQSMALMYAGGDNNFSGAAASAVARRLVLSNGAAYFTLLAYTQTGYKNQQAGNYNYIEIWSAESYVAGAANAAAGTNNRKLALCGALSAGPFTAYHLFGAASYLHLVVEESVGQFRHLSIGSIEKYGSWTGGAYAQASWWTELSSGASAFNAGNNRQPFGADKAAWPTSVRFYPGIRADIEAANVWVDLVAEPSLGMEVGRYGLTPWPAYARRADPQASDGNGLLAQWYDFTPLSWSGAAPLAPLEVSVGLSNGYWALLGAFPGVRYCNMANLAPGDEITLGSDVWKVFPVFGKNYTSGAWATSFDHALAYKK